MALQHQVVASLSLNALVYALTLNQTLHQDAVFLVREGVVLLVKVYLLILVNDHVVLLLFSVESGLIRLKNVQHVLNFLRRGAALAVVKLTQTTGLSLHVDNDSL